MQLSYLLVFSLIALVSANSAQSMMCRTFTTAKYDDLPKQPPLSVPNPIPPYHDLKYSNIVLLTPPADIMPASSPNMAGFGRGSTSSVTLIGGGPRYKIFAPRSITYACTEGAIETVANVPISCTLAFTGYKAGVLVKRQIVNYQVAVGEVNKTMSMANLLNIDFVDTINFEVVTPPQLAVMARFDNFAYYTSYL